MIHLKSADAQVSEVRAMNMKLFLMVLWMVIFIIAACGTDRSDDAKAQAKKPSPTENVFSAQENAMRKAKELNQLVEQHDQELRENAEAATQ